MAAVLYRVILPVHSGRHYFSGTGSAILACYDPKADGDEAAPWRHHPSQYIYFAVEDLEATRAACCRGWSPRHNGNRAHAWGREDVLRAGPFGNPTSFVKACTEATGEMPGGA